MLTVREKLILRMALSYVSANLDDLRDAFHSNGLSAEEGQMVWVSDHETGVHRITAVPTEAEVAEICAKLTGEHI